MPNSRPDLLRIGVALAAAATLGAGTLPAQTRDVLSSQIAVSGQDASLSLEFEDGGSLEVALRDGEVTVDGEPIGDYSRGDALETSWRSLLGDVVSLDDGPLARALVGWDPPAGLTGRPGEIAGRIDEALEARLAAPAAGQAPDEGEADQTGEEAEPLAALLRRAGRLQALGEALEGLTLGDVRLRIGEDVVVDEDTQLDATLVVLDGDVEVRGEVRGDVVVVDGSLRVFEGGRVTGGVRLVDARIFREGGTIEGSVENVRVDEEEYGPDVGELRDRIREEVRPDVDGIRERIREEVRRELRSEIRRETRGRSVFAPLRSVGRGIAGLLQNLISFAIVALIGIGLTHFFPENVDVVAETARKSPGRAAVVGLAGSFLLVPIWILGIVALAISIVGIPALLAWVPLFPVAACLAAGFGYLAVARNLGEWIARQRFQGLDFLRASNAFHTVVAGVAALLLPFALANVVEMGGHWLGFLEGLLVAAGCVAAIAAVSIGFGAVLLTRGGRRPAWTPGTDPFDLDTRWEEDVSADEEWSETRAPADGPSAGADEGASEADEDEGDDDEPDGASEAEEPTDDQPGEKPDG